MTIQDLRNQATKRADVAQVAVVNRLFDFEKARHVHQNGLLGIGCNCDYCHALHMYSMSALQLHRYKRMVEREISVDTGSQDYVAARAQHVGTLRAFKNQLLQEAII